MENKFTSTCTKMIKVVKFVFRLQRIRVLRLFLITYNNEEIVNKQQTHHKCLTKDSFVVLPLVRERRVIHFCWTVSPEPLHLCDSELTVLELRRLLKTHLLTQRRQ